MLNNPDQSCLELVCVIVNFGLGSKVIKIARNNGISGGTCFIGKGTVKNNFLEFLDITDIRKEIVLLIAEKDSAHKALEALDEKFNFEKPNHGIAFTVPITELIGSRHCNCIKDNDSKLEGGEEKMYNAIFTVVDKGNAETVMDAAKAAGAKGGTIINARGSGVHEHQKLFSMEIEPEKEIVLILSENSFTEKIAASIRETMKLDEPGQGILFIVDVNKTYGLTTK